jgi:hypothetical protein
LTLTDRLVDRRRMSSPTAPPDPAPRSRKTGVILLVLLLLLLALGVAAALYVAAPKARTPAPVAAQNTARPTNPTANVAGAPKAPDSPSPADQPSAPHDTPGGNAAATPQAPPAGQAAGAMGGFLGALSNAVGGVHRHDPVDFHALEALLPSSLPGMPDATPGGAADETMSIKSTSAHVDFTGPGDARIHLSITDATAISGLAGLADTATADSSEQGDSYEKTETIAGRSVHEKWDAAARHGQLSTSVGQRFAVDVTGDNVDMAALKNALARIDLAKLESMKDANPVAK